MTTRVTHADSGASFVVPHGWELVESTQPEVAALALEPSEDELFRANLVLTVGAVGGLSFRDWQAGTDQMLPTALGDYLLLDLEKLPVGGHPGGRRLAQHASPEGVSVTMEQWFALVDDVGITLTATVDTWRYDAMADELSNVAASLSLPRPGQQPGQLGGGA